MTATRQDDRIEQLLGLAEAHPEHLRGLVRCNDRIFLNPARVGGDVTAPLQEQFRHHLRETPLSCGALDDYERALATGVVDGAANGDDDDDEGDDLEENWNDEPVAAWAKGLASEARLARGMVVTPDGECIGPLPTGEWLEAHLEPTLALLNRASPMMAEGYEVLQGPSVHALEQLVSKLATAIERSVGASALGAMVSRLLLVLHYAGQGSSDAPRLPGDMRGMALGVALVAVRRLREASDDAAVGADQIVAAANSMSMALALEDQRAERIDELCRLGFVAAALAEQQRDTAARNDRALAQAGWEDVQVGGGGGGGWNGDDDDDDDAPLEQQILNVVLAACQVAASG